MKRPAKETTERQDGKPCVSVDEWQELSVNWATRDWLVYWAGVFLPAAVLWMVGIVYLNFAYLKEPYPDHWSPYFIPGLVGLLAGVLSGLLVRVAFSREVEREQLHLFFSIIATISLVISFCLWWGDWAVR